MQNDDLNLDIYDDEESKPKKPKFKLSKKQMKIIGAIFALLIIGYLIYVYVYLPTVPRNVTIVCTTENGDEIKCPEYKIYNDKGKEVSPFKLTPGEYTISFSKSKFFNAKKENFYVDQDWDQTKTFTFEGLEIKNIPKEMNVYPRIKKDVKIVFLNKLRKMVPYEVDILDNNSHVVASKKGYISKREQIVKIPVIFCKSTRDVCLGDFNNLTYKIKVKYGPIEKESELIVSLYYDPNIEIDGDSSVTLVEGDNQVKKIYSVMLDPDSPEPIKNVSIKISNLDVFVVNRLQLNSKKIDLYPGKIVEIPVIFKYANTPFGQDEFKGYLKLEKDLFEIPYEINVYLERKEDTY